jgi:hypothetical protein
MTKICKKCFQRSQEQNFLKHFVLVESGQIFEGKVQMMNTND